MQRKRGFTIALLALAAFMLAGAPLAKADPRDYLTGEMSRFLLYSEPRPVAPVTFYDARNNPVNFSAFRGKLVLVTLWASWCPYCAKEMPTLEALQKKLGPKGFMVLPICVDGGGAPVAADYYRRKGISALPVYLDPESTVGEALGTRGIPYNILLDKNGFEIGRNHGETDWMSPEAVAFLESYL